MFRKLRVGFAVFIWLVTCFLVSLVYLVTLGRGKRFCREVITKYSAKIACIILGIRIALKGRENIPKGQCVYTFNHRSGMDLLIMSAVGLTRTRCFLSVYTLPMVPITIVALCTGVIYMAYQHQPEKRVKIFKRTAALLKRTGESVLVSPEGVRYAGKGVRKFNKGAFHLALDLRAPLVPIVINSSEVISKESGLNDKSGAITVEFLPAVDTKEWSVESLNKHRNDVRDLYIQHLI